MAHHEKGQVSNLSFFVVHHPSELVTRQTGLLSFVNLRSKFLPFPIAKGYGKRQYSVLLQDTEVCRGTPVCGKRQYSLWRTKRQWDIIALLDSNSKIVIKYTYDEWGNYTAETLDYYDGKGFINADDISYIEPETIGGLNLYSYCGNSIGLYIEVTMENPGFRILIGTLEREEMVTTLTPIPN